jgi:tetratricopeptide (TPR) repeat protein
MLWVVLLVRAVQVTLTPLAHAACGNRHEQIDETERRRQTMDRERLREAIRLREMGRANQDPAILEEARTLLLTLLAAYPDEAEITYQVAIVHDNLGLEREAIPFYLQTLNQGLSGCDTATNLMKRERAFLGLGSTYRGLGQYQQAEETLRRGLSEFPQSRALQVFLAMALYNTQHYREAVELALTNLAETTADESLQYYQRGIVFYAQHLDETW